MTRRLAWLIVALGVLVFAAADRAHADSLTRMSLTGFAPVAGGGYVRVSSAFADPVTSRIWSSAGGRIIATDAVALTTRAAAPLAVSTAASVGFSDAALAVARCLLGGGVVCGGVAAAAAVYTAYRIYTDATGIKGDPGQATTQQLVWTGSCFGSSKTGSSALDAYSAACTAGAAAQSSGSYVYHAPTAPTCTVATNGVNATCVGMGSYTYTHPATGATANGNQQMDGSASKAMQAACPAVVDPAMPANNRPAGLAPGRDGLCPRPSTEWVNMTPEEAAARAAQYPPAFVAGLGGEFNGGGATGTWAPGTWTDALTRAVESPTSSPVPATVTTTGPATQTGVPSTTTETTGNPPVTSTRTETPGYAYTYNGPNVNVQTTSTTVVNNNGATTTTTTTGPAAERTPDPCIANPSRAGCSMLGTPPTDAPLWVNKPVTYAPDGGVGPAGTCPPDRILTFHGWLLPIKYQPLCDAAPIVKLGMIAFAALGAAVLITKSVAG